MSRGVLHAVVGPSGVGKDSLIDAARQARPDLHFPVRVITRPEGAGGEIHDPCTPEAFEARRAAGDFMLDWGAHGLFYGVPASAEAVLAGGGHVLVNLSRSRVAQARARFAPLRVLAVTAPASVLAARLAARGRESREEVEKRLARADLAAPEGPDVIEIRNDGPLERSVSAFLDALAPPSNRRKTPEKAPRRSLA